MKNSPKTNALLRELAAKVSQLPPDRRELLQDLLAKEAFSVEEVATLVGVHPETIRRHIRAGRLPAFRLTKHGPWRVRAADLEDALRARNVTPPSGTETGGKK